MCTYMCVCGPFACARAFMCDVPRDVGVKVGWQVLVTWQWFVC